jgi:hypothetical protein
MAGSPGCEIGLRCDRGRKMLSRRREEARWAESSRQLLPQSPPACVRGIKRHF